MRSKIFGLIFLFLLATPRSVVGQMIVLDARDAKGLVFSHYIDVPLDVEEDPKPEDYDEACKRGCTAQGFTHSRAWQHGTTYRAGTFMHYFAKCACTKPTEATILERIKAVLRYGGAPSLESIQVQILVEGTDGGYVGKLQGMRDTVNLPAGKYKATLSALERTINSLEFSLDKNTVLSYEDMYIRIFKAYHEEW